LNATPLILQADDTLDRREVTLAECVVLGTEETPPPSIGLYRVDPTKVRRVRIDAYNRKVACNVTVTDLAAPSPETCRWCPYKILCPSFWAAASAGWSGSLDGAAVEGVLVEPPRQIHAGAARALSLEIHAGSEASREINVAPVNPVPHDVVDTSTTGDLIRAVALRARSDGVFVPQMRTIVMRVDQLPELSVHTDPRPG
jgi:hypothetical protein